MTDDGNGPHGNKSMQQETVLIATADGEMETFIACPGRYPAPVVVLYMDALGIREELREMTRRMARAGYYSLLPNLFYRAGGPSFDPDGLPDQVDPRMHQLNRATTQAMVLSDSRALLEFLTTEDRAGTGPMASIGFCMGGRHAIVAAAEFPDRIRAAASVHGGFLVTAEDDSAHRRCAAARAELFFAFAEDDPVAPALHMATLERVMRENSIAGSCRMYRGSQHGFIFPQRYCYDGSAAEQVWEHWFAMLQRQLKTSAVVQ